MGVDFPRKDFATPPFAQRSTHCASTRVMGPALHKPSIPTTLGVVQTLTLRPPAEKSVLCIKDFSFCRNEYM